MEGHALRSYAKASQTRTRVRTLSTTLDAAPLAADRCASSTREQARSESPPTTPMAERVEPW